MTHDNQAHVRRRAGILAIVLTGCIAGVPLAFAQEVVNDAERIIEVLEALEAEENVGADVPDPEELDSAYRDLQELVAASPDDVRALLLLARAGRILWLRDPFVLTPGGVSSDVPSRNAALDALRHVLEIEPANVAAHYWLARIYGTATPKIVDDAFLHEPLDLERAIVHARRALELAPADLRHREALAVYLAEARRYAEAIAAFGDTEHVLRRILEDLESVPLPAGARYMPVETAAIADTMASRGRFVGFGALRVRAYVVDGGRAVFEAAFRERWRGFELYEAEREDAGDGATVATFAQVLRDDGGTLQPTPVETLARSLADDADADGALTITVLEFANPSDETLAQFEAEDTELLTVFSFASLRKPRIDAAPLTDLGRQLLGEWEIEQWRYRGRQGVESYTGWLRITAQTSVTELQGELFSRTEDGDWGRQSLRIVADGSNLELTGRVVAASNTWYPDDLSLTLTDGRLSGRSFDSSGEGGAVSFVKR
jgi:tetratricopeptide (TPR) repeat protein